MILPAIVERITEITTEQEGREALTLLQEAAARSLGVSKSEIESGILCLHLIREHRLYRYGGYESWGQYLDDFLGGSSVGRSLAYDLLNVARIWTSAAGFNLSLESLSGFGLYTARAATRDIVEEYDRATGEIVSVSPPLRSKLDGQGPLGEQAGRWIIEHVEPGTSAVMVSSVTAGVTIRTWVSFKTLLVKGKLAGIEWRINYPDGDKIEGVVPLNVPGEVGKEIVRLLKAKGDYREKPRSNDE